MSEQSHGVPQRSQTAPASGATTREDGGDRRSPVRTAILLWAIMRVPALAAVAYLLRYPILEAIEQQFDVFYLTARVIEVLSTPVTRIISGMLLFVILLLIVVCLRRLRPGVAYVILLVTAGVVLAVSFNLVATSPRRALVVELVLATNLAPGQFVAFLKRFPRTWNALMLAGVGVVELLLWREFWHWVAQLRRPGSSRTDIVGSRITSTIPALLIASVVCAFVLRPHQLLAIEQRIRTSAEVSTIERGLSFNWIALDPTGTYLYVTGHSIGNLRRYDVRNLSEPPTVADVPTGGAQGFAYDPSAGEVYVFNRYTRQLLYLDATTLRNTRAVEIPNLSAGDSWLTVDPATDTVALASEADLEDGVPFIVLDRRTGHVRAQANLATGNSLLHPTKSWLYLTFFRRRDEVILYDLERQSVTRTARADPRAERMAFSRRRNEVLVTSPMESRVMRFDADSLQSKGYIPALFGVRAIAIDEVRDVLLCGNIATGHLVTIDLATNRRLRTYYLGPWLRTIELHADSGTAYVSSNGALYRVKYAADTGR